MPNLTNRIERLEGDMLPKPPFIPAVTIITSPIGGYEGLAEAKALAEREGRPLIVVNLVPPEPNHDKSEIPSPAH